MKRLVIKHIPVVIVSTTVIVIRLADTVIMAVSEQITTGILSVMQWVDIPAPQFDESNLDQYVGKVLDELDALGANDMPPSPMLDHLLTMIG